MWGRKGQMQELEPDGSATRERSSALRIRPLSSKGHFVAKRSQWQRLQISHRCGRCQRLRLAAKPPKIAHGAEASDRRSYLVHAVALP